MTHDVSSNDGAFLAFCQAHDIRYETVHVIAFDVFDTLLYRTVSPQQVYTLWAQALIKEFSLKKTPGQVLKARFTASRIAKLRHILAGKDREAKYDDMAGILRILLKIPGSKQSFLDTCLRLELEVERSVTYVPEDRKSLLQSAMDTGKPVVCISDFYLPEETLRALLAYHGICPAQLFVSETYALQKATGKLYRKAAQLLQYEAGSILMIGDNRNSDFKAACNSGLQAIWLDSDAQHQYYRRRNEQEAVAKAAFFQYVRKKEQKPFEAVSYLLVLFIQRLYATLRQDGCQHVLFLSREGEFFKKLFDTYQEQCIAPEKRVRSHYFYASRKATLLPSIYTIDRESFKEIFKNYPSMSIITFLKNLGLLQNTLLLENLSTKMDIQREIPQFLESREFEALTNSELFCQAVLDRAKKQRHNFLRYLDSMNVEYENQGLYLVDIGYSGTSQNQIVRALGGTIPVHGYYLFSTSAKEADNPISWKTGLIYDVATQAQKDSFSYNPVMLEAIFMASHGAVLEYAERQGRCVPVLQEEPREHHCYETVVAPIQETILQEFSRLIIWMNTGNISEKEYYDQFLKVYRKFIFNPTETEICQYCRMVILDNFSAFLEKSKEADTKTMGKRFSWKSFLTLCKTKGWCLNQQNTNWMAAAFYKMNLWGMNPVLQRFSGPVMRAYDYFTRKAVAMRHKQS